MKKNLLWTMAAAVALASCSETELVEIPEVQEQNAIAFSTYLGDNAQSRAVVMDKALLGVEGFGVNAYYTKDKDYGSEGANPETFMQNTKVTLNKDKGTEGLWEYSPVKYWPNNDGDKVSFFAYGPHANNGKENNIELDGTDITFTVANEVKEQVDLIYNTNYDGTLNQEKPAVEDRILFKFDHALARIAFTVEAAVDEIKNGKHLLDGNTRINVKKVALVTEDYEEGKTTQVGPFYQEGTLSLLEPEEDKSPWTIDDEQETQAFVFNATDHFRHTVKDVDAKDINAEKPEKIDVMQLTRYNASEPQQLLNDSSFLMIIPQTVETFRIYIEYDVISEGYDNGTDTAFDGSGITNKILSDEITGMEFKKGNAYNFNLILGMTSVKFEADVTAWDETTPDHNEWLPENESSAGEFAYQDGKIQIKNAADLAKMRNLVNSKAKFYINEKGDAVMTVAENEAATASEGTTTESGAVQQTYDYADADYLQVGEIDLSTLEGEDATNWTPIGTGTSSDSFSGSYDGGNLPIKNLKIHDAGEFKHVGLFGYCNGATMENIYIANCDIQVNSSVYAGAITGGSRSNCSFTNCTVGTKDGNSTIKGQDAASISSDSWYSTYTDCTNYANIESFDSKAGGIASDNMASFLGCNNYGTVTATVVVEQSKSFAVAGISALGAVLIVDCHNYNTINGDRAAGIVVNEKMTKVIASHNEGEIRGGYSGAGICNNPEPDTTLELIACYNTGNISGNLFSAGLIAYPEVGTESQPRTYKLTACYNTGTCDAALVDYYGSADYTTITFDNCYYTGSDKDIANWTGADINGATAFSDDTHIWSGTDTDKTNIMEAMNNALADDFGWEYEPNGDAATHPLKLVKKPTE